MAKRKDEPTDAAPTPDAAAPEQAPVAAAPAPSAPADGEAKKKRKRPGVAPRRGKKLRNHLKNVSAKVKATGPLPVKQAVAMLKTLKRAKFDETVEVHINTGIDATQSDQMVRGAVSLPHGIGKSVRVVVFCQGDNVQKAKDAGANEAGSADLVAKVQGGWLDFDVAIATQDMMGQVSRLGKTLGPRGLMPTPKAGTVIPANADIAVAVKEFKAGKVEYRSDKSGQIHAGVGKMSFDDDKLAANIQTFVETVRAAKPSGVKGNYINGVVLSATMAPGVQVAI
ncbi:MAG TPA: 50S ribosomal protein L1 [Fimbriiglobus sp.]|nr:50S ribosomal protein L1 [Fimbriiglobus sp.]